MTGSPPAGPAPSLRVTHPDAPATLSHRCDPPLDGWVAIAVHLPEDGLAEAVLEWVQCDGTRAARLLPRRARNRFEAMVLLPAPVAVLHVHLAGSADLAQARLRVRAAGAIGSVARVGWTAFRGSPGQGLRAVARALLRMVRGDGFVAALPGPRFRDEKEAWRALLDERPHLHRARHMARAAGIGPLGPRLSILAAPRDPAEADRIAEDARAQIHDGWELILAGCEAAVADPRIRTVEGRSLADAERVATGTHVLVARPGQRLRPHAVLDFALTLSTHPGARIVFADEAVGSGEDDMVPIPKPAWSPFAATARDLVGGAVVIERHALSAAGGFPADPHPFALADTVLRAAEAVGDAGMRHLAKVLAIGPEEPRCPEAEWTRVAQARIARLRWPLAVAPHPRGEGVRLVPSRQPPPSVSIIVPTRDRADLLCTCIGSLLARTDHPDFEVLIVDNGSREEATAEFFRSLAGDARVRILPAPGPFNFSRLNNLAAAQARGEVLVLLNNDVEPTDASWLREMAGWAVLEGVGCVGAKLLYPGGAVQHAGVVPGVGHVFKHADGEAAGPHGRLVHLSEVSAVTAACLAVRASTYAAVGGLDETDFAVGLNDVDFCLKVAGAGYRSLWTPHAVLIHHESVSRGKEATPSRIRRFGAELRALERRWLFSLVLDPHHSPHQTREDESGGLRQR